jgi:glycine cleavage system H protein
MITPEDLFYSKAHLWVKKTDTGLLIGVTDHAQKSMGTLQYIDLPTVGAQLTKDDCFGGAETSKSVNDLFAPVDAVVAQVNEQLEDNPEIINSAPYEEGWLLLVTDYDEDDLELLMCAQVYRQSLE